MDETQVFAYVLKLNSESHKELSQKEQAIIDEHFEYLKRRLEEGKLIFAGRCLDREFGIAVFRARSNREAEEFVKNDPAVKQGVMNAKMYPFRVALISKEG